MSNRRVKCGIANPSYTGTMCVTPSPESTTTPVVNPIAAQHGHQKKHVNVNANEDCKQHKLRKSKKKKAKAIERKERKGGKQLKAISEHLFFRPGYAKSGSERWKRRLIVSIGDGEGRCAGGTKYYGEGQDDNDDLSKATCFRVDHEGRID